MPVCLFELRVFQTFLDTFTVHLFRTWIPNSRRCQHFCPRSGRFWLLELRVSQHFSTFYGPSVQAMETQLGARHRRPPPTIHRGRAQRTISAGSWFGQWPPYPPSSATAALPAPDRWRVTWRPPLSRMAGPGDPARTSAINPRGKETCVNRNFAACQARAAWRASGCLCAPGFAFLLKPIG